MMGGGGVGCLTLHSSSLPMVPREKAINGARREAAKAADPGKHCRLNKFTKTPRGADMEHGILLFHQLSFILAARVTRSVRSRCSPLSTGTALLPAASCAKGRHR